MVKFAKHVSNLKVYLLLDGIYFDAGKAVIKPESEASISIIAQYIKSILRRVIWRLGIPIQLAAWKII